jgi:uncharacterized RDD family membrane protein YckC
MNEQASNQGDGGHTSPRRGLGSWLSGPRSAWEEAATSYGYRGERLGLPETGPGSVAGFGRRIGALFIDWFAAILVTRLFVRDAEPGSPGYSLVVLGIFALEVWLLTSLSGASFGQRLLGLRVAGLAGKPVDPVRVLLRTLLLCLVIPAVVWDRDGRGLHDKAARSVVVRT